MTLRRCGGPTPICSLCGDEARPIADDLKTISVCGHVFHGFCLHRWIADRAKGASKTLACPVCKQPFGSERALQRLFFESSAASAPPSLPDDDDDEMRRRLDERLSSFVSAFHNQESRIRQLSDELYTWRTKAEREAARNKDAGKESERAQSLLQTKMEELMRKTVECQELQQSVSEMQNELAVFKLTTDLELGEEDMAEVLPVGRGMRHEDTIHVLKRAIALRNKHYKELKFQSDLIAREAKRTLRKYLKAREKIDRLKTRSEDSENRARDAPRFWKSSEGDSSPS